MINKNPVYKFTYKGKFPRKDMHRVDKQIFEKELVKQMANQNCGHFYLDDVPIYVNVHITQIPPSSWEPNLAKKLSDGKKPMTKGPNANDVALLVLNAMEGSTFTHRQQVAKFVVTKNWGWEERITIEFGVANNG